MEKITKKEIIDRLSEKLEGSVTKENLGKVYNATLEIFEETFLKGQSLTLPFGTFRVVEVAEQKRKVQEKIGSGEFTEKTFPAHRALKFRANPSIKEKLKE